MIITIHNSKGGCGKTTTACNVGVTLAAAGARVLLIDADLQGSATRGLGAEWGPGVYRWIVENRFEPVEVRPHLDLLASARQPDWKKAATIGVLQTRLAELDYDWILVDTHPEYDEAVTNFVDVSDAVLVPVDLGYYGVVALETLIPEIPPDRLIGLVPIRYDLRTNRAIELLDKLKRAGGDLVSPPIRQSVALDRAAERGLAAREFDPGSAGAEDYQILTEWMVTQLAQTV